MAIQIISQKLYDEFTGTGGGGVPYLIASVGDKIMAEIVFEVYRQSSGINLLLSATDNTMTRTDTGSFITDGWVEGEVFDLSGTSQDGSYTVQSVTEKTIAVVETIASSSTYPSASMNLTSEATAVEFFFGHPENDEPTNYFSKVDYQTQQRFVAGSVSPTGGTASLVVATNSKGWHYDGTGFDATIEGVSWTGYRQRFKITHTFLFSPAAIREWISFMETGTPPAPEYYLDRRCLKYVYQIGMKYTGSDPDSAHKIVVDSRKGNTSWFDETLNGETPDFSVSSVSYQDTLTTAAVDSFQITRATKATIILDSISGVFTSGSDFVSASVCWIRQDEEAYVNTRTTMRYNMAIDRALAEVDAGAVAGINNGTSVQWMTAVDVTFIDQYSIQIDITANIIAALRDRILDAGADNWKYAIIITTQDPAVTTTKGTDRVAVLADIRDFTHDYDESDLLEFTTDVTFLDAAGNTYTDSYGAASELLTGRAFFRVKRGRTIKDIGYEIIAESPTGQTATAAVLTFDTSGVCFNDGVQEIDLFQETGYRLLPAETGYEATIQRYGAIDNATHVGYLLTFPFKVRYEDWQDLPDAPCDLGDATQNWADIVSQGWIFKVIVKGTVENQNSEFDTTFEREIDFEPAGAPTGGTGVYTQVTTWDSTETYDLEGAVYIDENTVVTVTFVGGNSPAIIALYSGYVVTLYLDVSPTGGERFAFKYDSSSASRVSTSPWIGYLDDADPVDVSASGNDLVAKARLDYTKIDAGWQTIKIYATITYTP